MFETILIIAVYGLSIWVIGYNIVQLRKIAYEQKRVARLRKTIEAIKLDQDGRII